MLNIDRRSFLALIAALSTQETAQASSTDGDSLRARAAHHHRLFGASVASRNLRSDPQFAASIAREAGILVAEYETKRKAVEPSQGQFDFSGTDAILAFARSNGQLMRGHTLVWHQANPAWLEDQILSTKSEALITDYIAKVAGRYKGKFQSWDVVNEVVEPQDGHPDGLRSSSPWFKAYGEGYIDTAFHAARAADPTALLFYNETNVEGDSDWFEQRRTATLKLLERLVSRNVPIQGFGIQGHLKVYRAKYSEQVISKFLDEVGAMGLKVLITEYDVADTKGPVDPQKRDADIAALTGMFLDTAFSKPFVLGCLTWGLTDKYSWLSQTPSYMWSDGQLPRGLPLDANFERKPMWNAIASSFDRSAT